MSISKGLIFSLKNWRKKCIKFKTELCFQDTEGGHLVAVVKVKDLEKKQAMLKSTECLLQTLLTCQFQKF